MNRMSKRIPKPDSCGLCTHRLSQEESVVLLTTTDGGTKFKKATLGGVFCLPHDRFSAATYDFWRKSSEEVKSGEVAAVHSDCFKLFLQLADNVGPKGEKMNLLSQLTVWRSPLSNLSKGPYPDLADKTMTVPPKEVQEALGISELSKQPAEVLQMIFDSSRDEKLWQLSKVFRRTTEAVQIYGELPKDKKGYLLRNVKSWTRGPEEPVLTGLDLPVRRVTVDAYGIQSIESLSTLPPCDDERNVWKLGVDRYMIFHGDELNKNIVHFLRGMARTEGFDGAPKPPLWDTPSPPPLSALAPPMSARGSNLSYRVVNLKRVTGISFLFGGRKIMAMHVHTRETPDATTTFFALIDPEKIDEHSWHYVPISAADSMVKFGQRRIYGADDGRFIEWAGPTFVFRLAGRVEVGPYDTPNIGDREDTLLRERMVEGTPTGLVSRFNWDREEFRIHALIEGATEEHEFECPRNEIFPFNSLSTAPLSDIASIQLFKTSFGVFRGMIITYKNDSQRALGQCRLGVDVAEEPCLNPRYLNLANYRDPYYIPPEDMDIFWDMEVTFSSERQRTGPGHIPRNPIIIDLNNPNQTMNHLAIDFEPGHTTYRLVPPNRIQSGDYA